MKLSLRSTTLPVDVVKNLPVKHNGKVVGRVIGVDKDGGIQVVVEHDEVKRLLSQPNSVSIEVRAANEEVL